MSAPTVSLSALVDAAEALRIVKDMPADATFADWQRAAHRCALAYGHLSFYVEKITSSAEVEVTGSAS